MSYAPSSCKQSSGDGYTAPRRAVAAVPRGSPRDRSLGGGVGALYIEGATEEDDDGRERSNAVAVAVREPLGPWLHWGWEQAGLAARYIFGVAALPAGLRCGAFEDQRFSFSARTNGRSCGVMVMVMVMSPWLSSLVLWGVLKQPKPHGRASGGQGSLWGHDRTVQHGHSSA